MAPTRPGRGEASAGVEEFVHRLAVLLQDHLDVASWHGKAGSGTARARQAGAQLSPLQGLRRRGLGGQDGWGSLTVSRIPQDGRESPARLAAVKKVSHGAGPRKARPRDPGTGPVPRGRAAQMPRRRGKPQFCGIPAAQRKPSRPWEAGPPGTHIDLNAMSPSSGDHMDIACRRWARAVVGEPGSAPAGPRRERRVARCVREGAVNRYLIGSNRLRS